MLFARCKTCGKRLRSTARICERCGALTGVAFRTSDEPQIRDWIGFSIMVVAGIAYLLVLHFVAQEIARPRPPTHSIAAK